MCYFCSLYMNKFLLIIGNYQTMQIIKKALQIVILSLFSQSPIYAIDTITIEKDHSKAKLPLATSHSFFEKITQDYQTFYDKQNLYDVTVAFSILGVIANTDVDAQFQSHYQDNIRDDKSDNFAKTAKLLGEGKYLVPLSVLSSIATNNAALSKWGEISSRSYALGLPFMWATQKLTGASRPSENNSSKWQPLKDNNGVSGHAFVGAVPFLTLSKMYQHDPYLYYASNTASFLAAWSRVNDDAHYLSQALLGWYLAYESVDSVYSVEQQNFKVHPFVDKQSVGLALTVMW